MKIIRIDQFPFYLHFIEEIEVNDKYSIIKGDYRNSYYYTSDGFIQTSNEPIGNIMYTKKYKIVDK